MNPRKLKLFHTSDIHGQMLGVNYAQKRQAPDGTARLKTYFNEMRNPHDLYIDTGDTLQGNALAYYCAKHPASVHPFSQVMNALECDAWTPGNHDFNFGLDFLKSFTESFNGEIINANIEDANGPFMGKNSHIFHLPGGLTLGIIGLITHYIPNWENPTNIHGLVFQDAFLTAQKEVRALRDQVDILVVNYHGGFEGNIDTFITDSTTGENQGLKMLEALPEIDVLLTGHQHQRFVKTIGTTLVSQPGMNAGSVNVIEIPLNRPFKKGSLQGKTVMLDAYEEDSEIQAMLNSTESNTQVFLDQPMGSFDQDYLITDALDARRHKHPVVTWINDVQIKATGADMALCGLGNDVKGFQKSVTLRDILATYVYPNLLVVKALSGKAIKAALEQNAEFFTLKDGHIIIDERFDHPKKQYYNYDMFDPLVYTIEVRKPVGSRVSEITLHEEPLKMDATYQVAMNNYRAAGGGDFHMYKAAPLIHDTQKEIVEYLIEALEKEPVIEITHRHNITILGD